MLKLSLPAQIHEQSIFSYFNWELLSRLEWFESLFTLSNMVAGSYFDDLTEALLQTIISKFICLSWIWSKSSLDNLSIEKNGQNHPILPTLVVVCHLRNDNCSTCTVHRPYPWSPFKAWVKLLQSIIVVLSFSSPSSHLWSSTVKTEILTLQEKTLKKN